MKIGTKVKIKRGMPEFVGSTGTVIDNEKDGRTVIMNRVRLDSPVEIPGLGFVADDLWSNDHLVRVKS